MFLMIVNIWSSRIHADVDLEVDSTLFIVNKDDIQRQTKSMICVLGLRIEIDDAEYRDVLDEVDHLLRSVMQSYERVLVVDNKPGHSIILCLYIR